MTFNPGRSLGKKNPLNEDDLKDFLLKSKDKEEDENSWILDIEKINTKTWDLTVNNPNNTEEMDNRTPKEIIAQIEKLDKEAAESLHALKELL